MGWHPHIEFVCTAYLPANSNALLCIVYNLLCSSRPEDLLNSICMSNANAFDNENVSFYYLINVKNSHSVFSESHPISIVSIEFFSSLIPFSVPQHTLFTQISPITSFCRVSIFCCWSGQSVYSGYLADHWVFFPGIFVACAFCSRHWVCTFLFTSKFFVLLI